MRERKTSRILNDESFVLGLSYNDITGAALFQLGLIILFKALGIENMIWTLFITISVLAALVPIRMSLRRKIIRDSLKYVFKNGVIHVSKNCRK